MYKRLILIIPGVVFLLLFSSVVPISIGQDVKIYDINEQSSYRGNTLYVGGSGTNNYSKIQDAIDNSSDGDTVFVYIGTYYENVVINKQINLIGEDKNTTIIDGIYKDNVINITVDKVVISGFTIQNSSSNGYVGGIMIISNYNTISNNIIIKNPCGGVIAKCGMVDIGYNVVSGNIITDNGNGVDLDSGYFNNVSYNVIARNNVGINFDESFNSNIYGNRIKNNSCGIYLTDSGNNIFSHNQISDNKIYGVKIFITTNEKFIQNNFIGNKKNAYFIQPILSRIYFLQIKHHLLLQKNIWDGNYWERARDIPYPITGFINIWLDFGIYGIDIVNFIQFDRNPAKEPYDIGQEL